MPYINGSLSLIRKDTFKTLRAIEILSKDEFLPSLNII
ncbi:hypothetical protein T09_7262 [Trichinella sp. T9]|nr:hypothetical protein T09_7262 [Trichinella sp. T9]